MAGEFDNVFLIAGLLVAGVGILYLMSLYQRPAVYPAYPLEPLRDMPPPTKQAQVTTNEESWEILRNSDGFITGVEIKRTVTAQ